MANFEIFRKVPNGIEIWRTHKGVEQQIGFAGSDILLAALLDRIPTEKEEETLKKTGELRIEVK